ILQPVVSGLVAVGLLHLHHFPTRRSSDLAGEPCRSCPPAGAVSAAAGRTGRGAPRTRDARGARDTEGDRTPACAASARSSHTHPDRKSTRLNSSHVKSSYAVFCLKKKKAT